MKTLEDFKNEVAAEAHYGYENWKDMKEKLSVGFIEMDLIEERLELAAEKYAEYMALQFQNWLMEGNGFIEDTQAQKLHTDLELYKIFKEQNK